MGGTVIPEEIVVYLEGIAGLAGGRVRGQEAGVLQPQHRVLR